MDRKDWKYCQYGGASGLREEVKWRQGQTMHHFDSNNRFVSRAMTNSSLASMARTLTGESVSGNDAVLAAKFIFQWIEPNPQAF